MLAAMPRWERAQNKPEKLVYIGENQGCWNRTLVDYFFFSSRRRHTSCGRDWSSDVCSSDLFRETQLTNIKVGDPVDVRIDVYPGTVVRGRVLEIAPASGSQFALLPPDNATGNFTKVVQRVPVKIALDESALTSKLRPGLSA